MSICCCGFDILFQPRLSVGAIMISLGLMMNAGMLIYSGTWLIFSGPVISLGLTGKSVSAVK